MASHSSKVAALLRGTGRTGAVALAAMVLASCGGGDGGGDGTPVQLRTLSNRADLVSGGDALIEVTAPPGLLRQSFNVTVNGTDATDAFSITSDGRLLGVVTGLRTGDNTVVATVGGSRSSIMARRHSARLTITNAPRSGPVLSGAQVTPFYCATPTPQPAAGNTPATNASGLSGQPDANCHIPTEFKLYYRTTATAGGGAGQCSLGLPDPVWNSNGSTGAIPAQPTPPATPCWKPYTEGTTPADMATVTASNGATIPFVVRVERGTINRGIYDIAVLFDPTRPWTPTAPQAQWAGKIYYSFGASTGQPRRQSRSTATAWSQLEAQLKAGYLVASNSMTDSARNSNRVLMSETTMMMKEHIIDSYGPVRYTLGTGCSGGSINSNMNASIMPGLLDGVITSCTYPDSETTTLEVGDCVLLVEAYQKAPMLDLWTAMGLTQAQINAKKGAINGHMDQSACHAWYNAFGNNGRPGVYESRVVADNTTGALTPPGTRPIVNNCELPNSAVYDPANPVATATLPRCNAWGWATPIWGTNGNTPRDTRDNVGVQYGLRALLNGAITAEEFVVLNENVGGTSKDSTFQSARSQADVEALNTAYRAGIVASGRQLAKTAIIDLRGWDESNVSLPPGMTNPPAIPIHHQWYSFGIRDRITRDYGDAGNQALWRFAHTGLGAPGTLSQEAIALMDEWLTTLVTDHTGRSIEEKVRAARPAGTRDFCLRPADPTTRVFDMAACDADPWLKPTLSPRQVAGGPRSEDVLKCQLKPLDPADYPAGTFTAGQWSRLQAVFSTGVCDWTKPGVGQQVAVSPLTFRAGPGGEPLGPAPVSQRED